MAFGDADVCVLVGAMPRKAGMERSDLLSANGAIFTVQGKAIADNAKPDAKVLVVGNPANTNALIAMSNAKGMDPGNFTAMTRLDHNRAISQLAAKLGVPVASIKKMTIWGNHSTTQYPDLFHARGRRQERRRARGRPGLAGERVHPHGRQAGRRQSSRREGSSSAASAANAAIDHMRNWHLGTPDGDWVSMSVPSDGSYGVPEGIISSFPCTCRGGRYEIVQGLELDDFSRARIDASVAELLDERNAVKELGLI